jgi:hypothetical protein
MLAAESVAEYEVSHKHDNLLEALFQNPVSSNIHWREVESLLAHLGARVDPHAGAKFHILLNGSRGRCTARTTAAC